MEQSKIIDTLETYQEAAGQGGGRAKGGVLLPPVVGLPLFLVGVGEEKEGREERRKGGAAPSLSNSD